MDEAGLGLPTSTLDDLEAMVSRLSFETCMVGLSQAASHLAHIRGNTQAQIRFAGDFFGDSRLVAKIRRLARRDDGMLEVFPEQHTTSLQRLLIIHARNVPLGQHDRREQATFNRAYIATSCLAENSTRGPIRDAPSRAEWLAFFIQPG